MTKPAFKNDTAVKIVS